MDSYNGNLKDYIDKKFDEMFEKLNKSIVLSTKKVLTVKELATITGLSVGYIYNLVSAKKIPHYKSNGGKLTFFKREEVEYWLCDTRVYTYDELNNLSK